MAKYMILYNSSEIASELMAKASPEEMRASMDEWIKWRDEASKTLKIDFGMPLQAASHVSEDGITDSNSQVSGYSTAESDSKEALIDELMTHPQLKRAGASIDVLEMLAMPGM